MFAGYFKKTIFFLFISVLLTASFFWSLVVFAAPVSSLTAQPTTLVAGAAANQKFLFTLTSVWSEGNTLTLTFPAGYDTSAIVENDVDIVDGAFAPSTATDCSGTERVSINMSGNVLTMTVCPGDGGALGVGANITIKIGTNADESGLGTHRIVNPVSAGTYYVNLGGTSGNSGSIPIPIVAADTSGVSITVSGTSPDVVISGGGTGSPPPAPAPTPTPAPIPEPTPAPTPQPTPEPTPAPEPAPITPPAEPTTTSPAEPGYAEPTAPTPGAPTAGPINGESTQAPTSEPVIPTISVSIGDLILPVTNGQIDIFGGSDATVTVEVGEQADVTSVVVVIGEETFVLSPAGDNVYSGTVRLPANDDSLSVVVNTTDGREGTATIVLSQGAMGTVYETVEGVRVPVENAILTLYQLEGGAHMLFDVSSYGESNPEISTAAGSFGWYVPNGTYIVVAERDGYTDQSVRITVADNILAVPIELTRLPAALPSSEVFPAVIDTVTAILSSPEAATTARVAAVVSTVAVVSSVVTLASGFGLLAYLQYLFTAPLLIFGRKKRKNFGVVYNAMTKIPIELAIVRLYRAADNRLVKSVVTNPKGEYFLLVSDAGDYRLSVTKPGFVFPSAYLLGVKDDGKFLDVYTNQLLQITEKGATVTANIPLDPSDAPARQSPRALKIKRLLRTMQHVVAPLGMLCALVAFIVLPSIFSGIMLAVQTFALLLAVRLAWPKKPKGWGLVAESASGKPLGNVVVRLFEPRYNKLVESTLTDSQGRYSFLLGPNEYFVSFTKEGFVERLVRPIDYSNKTEPTPLTVHVALDKS